MKWFVYIILPTFLVSCDLFQTRPPEGPDQSRSNYISPSEPKILIENIINSFSDKNADNYRKSFESNPTSIAFTFIPTSSAQVTYQSIWLDWNIDSEFQYFKSAQTTVPSELPMTLSLSTEQGSFSVLGADSVKYNSKYSISIPQYNSNALNYQGNVEFTLIRDSRQIWVINYWKDYAIQDNPSWSDLKGSYAN
ncbi:hypothetical protein LJE86_06525 [bacterium BMS3Abin03]|jgi:hypothetical protein|nr:hypothetical protein [bacterium BMS3Abin03]MCG6959314.1 hypothetical protein [bacterium BMS3Abin03]